MFALATRSRVGTQSRSPAVTGRVTGSPAERSMRTEGGQTSGLTPPRFAQRAGGRKWRAVLVRPGDLGGGPKPPGRRCPPAQAASPTFAAMSDVYHAMSADPAACLADRPILPRALL